MLFNDDLCMYVVPFILPCVNTFSSLIINNGQVEINQWKKSQLFNWWLDVDLGRSPSKASSCITFPFFLWHFFPTTNSQKQTYALFKRCYKNRHTIYLRDATKTSLKEVNTKELFGSYNLLELNFFFPSSLHELHFGLNEQIH